jgi:hypothetical protein
LFLKRLPEFGLIIEIAMEKCLHRPISSKLKVGLCNAEMNTP